MVSNKAGDGVIEALRIEREIVLYPNTFEELERCKRVICGSESCQTPEDARYILEALGLIETPGETHGEAAVG